MMQKHLPDDSARQMEIAIAIAEKVSFPIVCVMCFGS